MAISDDYFAGLFDGEGCVSARIDKKGCVTLSVSVQMCARDPVVAIYERFGGFFRDGKRKTASGSRVYVWAINNVGAVECLEVLSKKCINKRAACISALKIAKSMAQNSRKQPLSFDEKIVRLECVNSILLANSRGGKRTTLSEERIKKFLSEKDFGRKSVSLSDGRVFESMSSAAKELGVTCGAIWHAVNGGCEVKGFKVYKL